MRSFAIDCEMSIESLVSIDAIARKMTLFTEGKRDYAIDTNCFAMCNSTWHV